MRHLHGAVTSREVRCSPGQGMAEGHADGKKLGALRAWANATGTTLSRQGQQEAPQPTPEEWVVCCPPRLPPHTWWNGVSPAVQASRVACGAYRGGNQAGARECVLSGLVGIIDELALQVAPPPLCLGSTDEMRTCTGVTTIPCSVGGAPCLPV